MEAVSALVFIGLAIVAIVQLGKNLFPPKGEERDTRSACVIVAAFVVGALVGVLDVHIGIPDVSVAQGIVIGLDAVGLHTVARQVG